LAAPGSSPPPPAEEVSIPFVNFGGVRTFHAEDEDSVYIEDKRRRWYRGEIIGPCWGLRWAHRIGIETKGSSSFDRYSALIVDGERCQLTSLTRSEKPARRAKKPKRNS
jgi:hypothetical protein